MKGNKQPPSLSPVPTLRRAALVSLMAALIAGGSWIAFPLGPVPLVLTNGFVLLSGLLLGPRLGVGAAGLFILAGAAGMPVFSGGRGGVGHILGLTGGYIFGYLPAAALAGWVSARLSGRRFGDVLASALGVLAIYALGVPWLKMVAGMTWGEALAAGVLPFLPGDVLKAAAAVYLARKLRPALGRLHP